MRRLLPHVRRVLAPDALAHGFSDTPSRLEPAVVQAGMFEALDAALRTVDEFVTANGPIDTTPRETSPSEPDDV